MNGRALSRIIEELKQQQRQALEAALREKIDHHDTPYLGLSAGFLSLIGSIELTLQAVKRLQEGGEE